MNVRMRWVFHQHPVWVLTVSLLCLTSLAPHAWGVAQLINGDRTHAGATNAGVSTGTGTAYVLTLDAPIPGYAAHSCYLFEAHVANTGPATININGRGALSIVKYVSGVATALSANDIGLGQLVEVCYDGPDGTPRMQTVSLGGGGSGLSDPGANGLVNRTALNTTTAVPSSSTVGQTLRVTGSNVYGWGPLNLAEPAAITGTLPAANIPTNYVTLTGTQALENKQYVPRVVAIPVVTGTPNTITPNCDTTDIGTVNNLTLDVTIQAPTPCTGSNPRDGQDLTLRVTSSAARVLTWNAIYTAENGLTLPTATTGTAGIYDYMMFRWNAVTARWGLTARTMGGASGSGLSITTLSSSRTYTCNPATSRQCEMTMTDTPGGITMAAPGPGTPVNGDTLRLMLRTTNVQTLTWDSIFIPSTSVALPPSTPALTTTWTVVDVQYSSVLGKWQAIAASADGSCNCGAINLPLTGIKMHPSLPTGPAVAGNSTTIWFDDTLQECVLWETMLPRDYAGSPVLRLRYVKATSTITSHIVAFDVSVWDLKAGASVQSPSFAAVNNCDDSVSPNAVDVWDEIVCPLTNFDTATANATVQFQVCSDVATGTWTGDLGLNRVRFEYAK